MVLNFRKERIYSKSRKSPCHAYIDPNARGTGYIILYAYGIYTAVRHKTPLPGYRVSGLGSRVSRVPITRVTGHQGHWSPGSLVIGFPYPWSPWFPGSHGSRVPGQAQLPVTRHAHLGFWLWH
jgi:hypothetical protein